MRKRAGLLLLIVLIALTACKKYDEGPSFSLYSKGKRIEGTWYFTRVAYNDIDSTDSYLQSSIDFYLGEGSGKDWGIFTWRKGYDPNNSSLLLIQPGGWKFFADKDSIQMVLISERTEDYDTIQWKINRLAYDQWWLERYINDTTKLSWQLWKWVM